ncbi:MAG: molybdenum cofactor guanylyltransferase [Firmicutes bacterium]|jgi:molybdopterin-guanine dinucleotide biosynthesis protein A|nr:molybdenum cofactor guanylyltransferase [Bacillota bacterium]
MRNDHITGAVLAGGKSRRMGLDKPSIVVDGRQMIMYVVDALREAFSDILIVAKNADDFHVPGVRTIGDCIEGNGPLVGIYSALSVCKTPYCFVIACDMPCADSNLIRWMVTGCDGYDIFIPRLGSYLEPLFALYSRKCMAPIRDSLAKGDYRVRSVFSKVNIGYADETDIRAIDPELRSFVNINTKEDLCKFMCNLQHSLR